MVALSAAETPVIFDWDEVSLQPIHSHVDALPDTALHDHGSDEISVPLETLIRVGPFRESDSSRNYFKVVLSSERSSSGHSESFVRIPRDALEKIPIEDQAQIAGISNIEYQLYSTGRIGVPTCIFEDSLFQVDNLLAAFHAGDSRLEAVCGLSGAGKTHFLRLALNVAQLKYGWQVEYINCKQVTEISTTMNEIMPVIDGVFEPKGGETKRVIAFDDLDYLAPAMAGDDDIGLSSSARSNNPILTAQSKLVADSILNNLSSARSNFLVLATCESSESVNASLIHQPTMLEVPVLDGKQRFELLCDFVSTRGERLKEFPPSLFDDEFVSATESFRPKDLAKVSSRLLKREQISNGSCIPKYEILQTVRDTIPLSNLAVGRLRRPVNVNWDEIGGLFETRKKLEKILLFPMRYKSIYEKAKSRLPHGILLFGPTGCGKSSLVPALALKCDIPIISCRGPEILDRYIGASEAKVRDLFSRAASVAPSILFLDEIDALAPRRGSDNTSVTDRVVNQLLTYLDGVEDGPSSRVFIIAATSRPDKIDPALLRPGRLEEHIFVGPPETDLERIDLLRRMSCKVSLSSKCKELLNNDEAALDVLSRFQADCKMSPVDLKAALDTAQLKAVHRHLTDIGIEAEQPAQISFLDLTAAISETSSSTSTNDSNVWNAIYDRFRKKVDFKGIREVDKQVTTLR